MNLSSIDIPIEQLIEGCSSNEERIFLLTKEIGGLRKLITSHKHENDRLKENLRIKERELAVQYEENDRLTYNYDRLKKRVGSLQSELKEKKSKDGFFGSLFKKGEDSKAIEEQLMLSQELLGRTIQDNENITKRLENQTKETQLIEERLKSEISKSQKFAEESEKELKDLREVCEKREMEIQKHIEAHALDLQKIEKYKKENQAIEHKLRQLEQSGIYFRECLRGYLVMIGKKINLSELESTKNHLIAFARAKAASGVLIVDICSKVIKDENSREEFDIIKSSIVKIYSSLSNIAGEIGNGLVAMIDAVLDDNHFEVKSCIENLTHDVENLLRMMQNALVISVIR